MSCHGTTCITFKTIYRFAAGVIQNAVTIKDLRRTFITFSYKGIGTARLYFKERDGVGAIGVS